MKNSILFLVLISFLELSVSAQQGGLLVTKYKNQKSKFIKEDSKIRIKSEGKTVKGRFRTLSDSTILIQADTILLTQISEIRVTKFSSQLGGGILLIAGTYITAGGIFGVASFAAESGGEGLILALLVFSPLYVGGAFIAATGIFLLFKGQKYAPSKWKYRIVRTVPVAGLN